jgi:endopeptidase La
MTKLLLNKSKLQFLQEGYHKLTRIISKLNHHLEIIQEFHLIDFNELSTYQNELYDIIKSINSEYNLFLKKYPDEQEENILVKYHGDLLRELSLIDKSSIELIEDIPLSRIHDTIVNLIGKIGFYSLDEGIKMSLGEIKYNLWKSLYQKFIEELEEIFLPTKIILLNDKVKTKFSKNPSPIFKMGNTYLNDVLKLTCTIKFPLNNDLVIQVQGIFPKNNLNLEIKTCQILRPILFEKKKNLNDYLEKKTSIPDEWLKSYLRNINLAYLYSYSNLEFCKMIEKDYTDFLELSNSTFVNVMKKFVHKNTSIQDMFRIIFIFLLGNDDTEDMASLLYSLIKEKKIGTSHISKLIYNNLSYYQQIKLKRANYNLKEELEKIQNLDLDEVDYKKQLLVNKNIPDKVRALALEKVEEMKNGSNDYYKQLTFVKYILKFPWPSPADDLSFLNLKDDEKKTDYIKKIDDKLMKLSYGHTEAKKSLLQLVGKWISNPNSTGTAIGLVGPPGVGKTLLAKSVSEALEIPFAQITLGGQNDGELLHGHGYTYTGSQPGMIIKKMIETGKQRCIIYFDELDKASAKNGKINEITSILIHLTDPNMNVSFQDRFFQGIDFPLSKVIFMFSYNDSDLIDPILLDRIKEIKVKPYTNQDKLHIVKNFMIKEICQNIGLEKNLIELPDKLIEDIVENYTNEAGVRGIKRIFEDLFLNLNLDKIYGRGIFKRKKNKIILKKSDIEKYLEKPNNEIQLIHPDSNVGIINGLYATSTGLGGIIPIQIFNNYKVDEGFEIKLTGKQGDVMKESVHCSYTAAVYYLDNHRELYQVIDVNQLIKNKFKNGFHVHAPSTSTPKDGPSAGCAFTSAFISRILDKKIKNTVGMTGEIELTGKITKIGGLIYKLIGAKKAGVKLVFIPKENEDDLKEIKEKNKKLIDDNFEVKLVDNISEIIPEILV